MPVRMRPAVALDDHDLLVRAMHVVAVTVALLHDDRRALRLGWSDHWDRKAKAAAAAKAIKSFRMDYSPLLVIALFNAPCCEVFQIPVNEFSERMFNSPRRNDFVGTTTDGKGPQTTSHLQLQCVHAVRNIRLRPGQ